MTKPTPKDYLNILKEQPYFWLFFTLTILSGVGSIFIPALIAITFSLVFVFYDYNGYKYIVIDNGVDTFGLRSYRILQGMFHAISLVLIFVVFGWVPVVIAEILHLFGIADLLYYFYGKYKLPKFWTWLGWTPFGWFKNKLSMGAVWWQAIFGVLISILLVLVTGKKN